MFIEVQQVYGNLNRKFGRCQINTKYIASIEEPDKEGREAPHDWKIFMASGLEITVTEEDAERVIKHANAESSREG